MENPATWNKCIKVLNQSLNWGNDLLLNADKVLVVLIANDLLVGVGKMHPNNSIIRDAINSALENFRYEIENQCCGNSLGSKIYYALKKLDVVE